MQESAVNEADFVEIGLTCADICQILSQARGMDQSSQTVPKAIEQLET